mgnify:CR=1 FL=1
MIDLGLLDGREATLAARAGELFSDAISGRLAYPKFIGFLDEYGQEIVLTAAAVTGYRDALLYGGYENSERNYLGVFPEYMTPDKSHFPITPVTMRYREADRPSHRDFLGAMLALGIKREAVGDILVGTEECVAFLSDSVAGLVTGELAKVGRTGIRISLGHEGELPVTQGFLTINGTVGSDRLDCVTALVTKLSREKASALISGGSVRVNGCTELSASHRLNEGDRLSIKGYGKFLVEEFGANTKKGRVHVICKKYI